MPFVGQAEEKRTFSDVTVCAIKLRNFESFHRSNATETLVRVVYYSDWFGASTLSYIVVTADADV